MLRFKDTPDYEDANEDRFYDVTVTASDGTLTSEPFPVTVEVMDAPGELCLSSSASRCLPLRRPRVGQEVHAILDDLDGIDDTSAITWRWEGTTQ